MQRNKKSIVMWITFSFNIENIISEVRAPRVNNIVAFEQICSNSGIFDISTFSNIRSNSDTDDFKNSIISSNTNIDKVPYPTTSRKSNILTSFENRIIL